MRTSGRRTGLKERWILGEGSADDLSSDHEAMDEVLIDYLKQLKGSAQYRIVVEEV